MVSVLTVPTKGTATFATVVFVVGTGCPLQYQTSDLSVEATSTTVAVIRALPPFWTDKPKGWTAKVGGPPRICACAIPQKPIKANNIATFSSEPLIFLWQLSIIQDTLAIFVPKN